MLPSKITKGDSLQFTVDPFRDEQARNIAPPDWTLKYSIRGSGNNKDFVSDSNWKFSVPTTQTSDLVVGSAFYQLTAINSGTSERVTVSRGQIEILANMLDLDQNADGRSQTQKDLEDVQNLIRQLMKTGGVVEYKIGTRSARKYDLAELRAEETKLRARLIKEQKDEMIAKGQGNPHKVSVRFTR